MKKGLAFAILGLLSFGLTACGVTGGIYANEDKYISGNTEYKDVEVNKIDIDWVSGNVTLVEDEAATGIVVFEDTNLTDKRELVHSYFHDGILNVKYFASGYHCLKTNIKKNLTITYKPGLETLKVDLTSGYLGAENIHATKFDLDITSGTANIKNLVVDEVSVDATSGTIIMSKIYAKKMDADLTSGSITTIYESLETATYEMTSGKVFLTLPIDGGTVKVDKTSGTVKTNRECTINNNTYKFGTGLADVKVKMTSGTLSID